MKHIDSKKMGSSDLGWLQSKFHFSFADYHNPENIQFGNLRVINDDLIHPHTGFEKHPHRDMEIISYVVDGELSHKDSMGNESILKRGEVQYMSAGTGVYHSEHNRGDEMLRILQIWIYPDARNHLPNYGEYRFPWAEREGKWLQLVSSKQGDAPIKINQDVRFSVISLKAGEETSYPLGTGRQGYLVQIEGESLINQSQVGMRDAVEAVEEELRIRALSASHILMIELAVS